MKSVTKLLVAGLGLAFAAVQWSTVKFDPERLRGARVLVTGASSGIGEEMSYHYARFGAQLVLTARRERVLQQVADKCLSLGAQKALYVAGDMATDSNPDTVLEFTLEHLGGLDYLVLNHMGPVRVGVWTGDMEHFRWIMKVNFYSYVQMAWAALPALEQSKGALLMVSSLAGKLPVPLIAPYAATKSALNGFFGSLQHELAMKNSNVSLSICTLGLTDTEAARHLIGTVTNDRASPASEAALNIIRTGVTRQAELYYPHRTYFINLMKDWCPAATDYLIRHSAKPVAT